MRELSPDSDALSFSESWHALYGDGPGKKSPTLASFRDRTHPDDREAAREALVALIKGTQADYVIELLFCTKAAGCIWIMERAMGQERDAKGRAILVVGMHADITEQKKRRTGTRTVTALARACDRYDPVARVPERHTMPLPRRESQLRRCRRSGNRQCGYRVDRF
ncbi:MAG: PAS domain-containing protein [Gammaproteobacteria bacterium]